MAFTLSKPLPTATIFSCDIEDITLSTDQPSCAITIRDSNGEDEILTLQLYAYAGSVTAHSLRSVIEAYMEKEGQQHLYFIEFEFDDGDDSTSFSVPILYCRTKPTTAVNAQDFISQNFLTAFPARVQPRSMPISFFYFTSATNVQVKLYLYYTDANGEIKFNYQSKILLRQGGWDILEYTTSYSALLRIVALVQPKEILAVSIAIEDKVATVFFTNAPLRSFAYRSRFGFQEYVAFPASEVMKTTTDFATAICKSTASHYDIQHHQEHEMQSASLYQSQIRQIQEMLLSPEVFLYEPDNSSLERILIKSYTSEISDNPGDSNAIKMAWELADQQLHAPLPQAASDNLFSEQFNFPFA